MHHVYKVIWTPFIGEELLLEAENGNLEDRHAVAGFTCLIQLHPQCHAWADGTKTELLPWAFKRAISFNRGGRLIK